VGGGVGGEATEGGLGGGVCFGGGVGGTCFPGGGGVWGGDFFLLLLGRLLYCAGSSPKKKNFKKKSDRLQADAGKAERSLSKKRLWGPHVLEEETRRGEPNFVLGKEKKLHRGERKNAPTMAIPNTTL